MKREFKQHRLASKPKRRLRWFVGFIVLVAVLGGGIWYYQRTHSPETLPTYFSNAKRWLTERRNHLKQGVMQVKQLTAERDEEAETPVHFEFYNTLPEMHVAVANTTPSNNTPTKPVAKKQATKKLAIYDAEALERDVSAVVAKHSKQPVEKE